MPQAILLGLGPGEIIVIVIAAFIVLIIFGPKNLPKLGKSLGKGISGLRKGMSEDEDKKEDNDEEDDEIVVEEEDKKEEKKKPATKKKVVKKKSE
ncbi:MAG: twin-arginine translocase TatA/TatE family subunit [Coriobacteriia bacterium]|nr:twin-arginine translocase TatA/TatE family subunit [Coriobacteriia bacterium]